MPPRMIALALAVTAGLLLWDDTPDDPAPTAPAFQEHSAPATVDEPAAPKRARDWHMTIQEDHPAWDCETMGNRRCGPVDTR